MSPHLIDTLTRRARAATAVLLLSTVACATASGNFPADAAARAATGTPASFMFNTPPAGSTCRSPALDTRDGTRLKLARSADNRGDYEVPGGRYGVSNREYLRLDCSNGAVVGVVPRS
jgi:hypothetical protein